VLVYQVLPDSPAAKAGLKDGDILKTFDGQPVEHSRQLIDRVSSTPAGRKVTVAILREGTLQDLRIEIGERPSEIEVAGGAVTAPSWRGIKVEAVTPDLAQQFGISPESRGVIIVEVEPASLAETAGLRPGDVINEVNRVKIETITDYRRATDAVTGNALVRTNRGYVVIKAGG